MAALGLRCCVWAFLQLWRVGATLRCAWASHCGGLSRCRAWALVVRASVVVALRLSSCGSQALELRLSSCGARAQLLRGMRDPPGPGVEPVFPALAGGFPTTAPPGKSRTHSFEGISPLCPALPGKAIKLFFLLCLQDSVWHWCTEAEFRHQ